MKFLSHLAVGVSVLVACAAGQQEHVKRLEMGRVLDMKGAILVKNGSPTTCELALNSEKVAFVAAACLDYKPNSNIVDSSARYQVMLTYDGKKNRGIIDVNSAIAHPKYNPRTFANNVAILNLEPGNQGQWRNYIAANPKDWQSLFYVDRKVTTSGVWAAPQIIQSSATGSPQCASASSLYAANSVDFLCTSQTVNKGGCSAPYGGVYGVRDPDLAVAALYSHSVIVGGDLCSSTQIYNYYTVLSNYLEWGGAVSRSTIYLYTADKSYVNNNNPNYHMVEPSAADNINGMIVAGDLNTNKGVPIGQASIPQITSSAFIPGMNPVPTGFNQPISSSEHPADAPESGKKVSVSTILLIVAAILLLLALLGWFLYKRFKRRPAPTHEMTQYNNNEYALGAQNYAPEYVEEYPTNRQHLDNEIVTRDSYNDPPHNAKGKDNGFMD
ncbi:hypothetical protein LPJ61_000354 [Coemansia biformis]|uniref:Peptidase S1 domain-containing protein n=1 Tax=Coemansia biformis TaxID=1286918 RepID=A0A9W7YJU0_9FUNG|nr:hypothetical protein LPJ61_000354 [Coemansia biformis]